MTGLTNGPAGGWIKLWRRYMHADHPDHPMQTGEPMSDWGAWIDLLGQAQWSEEGELEAGQLQASRSYLQRRWNWTEKHVRVWLDKKEDEGAITTHHPGGRAPSIITVCNWHEYQGSDANQGADQGCDAPSWQGPEKGPAKGPANGPARGQQTPRNHGENSGSGASKRPATGPAQGPEKGPEEVKKYKKREEKQTECAASQDDPAPGLSAENGTAPTPEQPSLLKVPEDDPAPDGVDREVARWHQTACDMLNEHRGNGSGSRTKLTDFREGRIRQLLEAGYSHDSDWVPGWRGILASDYWAGKSGGRLYDSLLRKGGQNLERNRDDWQDRQSSTSPSSTLEGDELEELQRQRDERLRRERERVAASQ